MARFDITRVRRYATLPTHYMQECRIGATTRLEKIVALAASE